MAKTKCAGVNNVLKNNITTDCGHVGICAFSSQVSGVTDAADEPVGMGSDPLSLLIDGVHSF